MQRFREGVHGLDSNETFLPESGIIAYIKDSDFDFWLKEINQWIIDAAWNKSEQLQKAYFKNTAKLSSQHSRYGSPLILHHFWVKVKL